MSVYIQEVIIFLRDIQNPGTFSMCEGMYVNIIDSFSDHFEKMTTLQPKCAQYRGQADFRKPVISRCKHRKFS